MTPSRPRPHRHDVAIAVCGLLSGLVLWRLELFSNRAYQDLPYAVPLLPVTAMACAGLLRRVAPRTALAVGVLALAGDQVSGSLISTIVMFTDVVYASVLYGTPAWARRATAGSVFLTIASTVVPVAVFRKAELLVIGVALGLVTIAPAWTGWMIRSHRDTAAAERLRAEQTALLAEMDRRAAVGQERARMARELHDMVANHLSAIAIHSTAALSVSARDPEAPGRALTVIRESSVQGLSEMRRLIGLLRTAAAQDEPTAVPRMDALDALLDHARAAGAAGDASAAGDGTAETGISFELVDERPAGVPLPAPLELAGYRIVQESVTNALKHGSRGAVTVHVEQSARALTITVDSPFSGGPGPRAPGAGAGLVGMEERADLLGGTFEAGPVATAGGAKVWRVRAELPSTGARAEAGAGAGASAGEEGTPS